jgi:hypothetical protein
MLFHMTSDWKILVRLEPGPDRITRDKQHGTHPFCLQLGMCYAQGGLARKSRSSAASKQTVRRVLCQAR